MKVVARVAYTISNKQNANTDLILIPRQPQILLHPIQSRIPNVHPIQEAEQVQEHDQWYHAPIHPADQRLLDGAHLCFSVQ